MRKVALFVEDFAHETFLGAMVQRLGREYHVEVAFRPFCVRGGSGKVVRELRQFRDSSLISTGNEVTASRFGLES